MEEDIRQSFRIGDYIVFSLTVLISLGIGIYFAKKGKDTTSSYFLGDRKLHYLPVALSLVVTFQSSIMLLGFPAEVYLFGYMICLFNIGQFAAILLATRIVTPLMHPLKITSVYEYLELRFKSNYVRLLAVVIGVISNCTYMGVVLFGPATALQSVTNLPAWASILGIAVAAAIYTSIGGINAVIWTDVIQCLIIIIGIVSILIKGTIDAGGIGYVLEKNSESGRLDILDFNPDPTIRHTFWTVMTGSFIGSFSLTLAQSTIQRMNSTPSVNTANRVLYIAGPIFVVMQMMSMSVGLVCFAYYYSKSCDPLLSGNIVNPNQIVPYMIVDIFSKYQGLSGLFISALFSASLSTLSSFLSGLSAVTIEDLIKPYTKFTDKMLTLIAKLCVIVYACIAVGIAFLMSQIQGSLTQILFSIMGASTGPSVGIFFLAMFYPLSTSKGVIIGGVSGMLISFWICIGATVSTTLPKPSILPLPPTDMCFPTLNTTTSYHNVTVLQTITSPPFNITPSFGESAVVTPEINSVNGLDQLYSLSYALFSTIGTLATLIIGAIASAVTYDPVKDKPDPKLMLPFFDQMCCCFKRSWLRHLRCGIKYPISKTDEFDTAGKDSNNHIKTDLLPKHENNDSV